MLQREHSAILSTFIKLPFAIKTLVLSIFEWPLKTGLTVYWWQSKYEWLFGNYLKSLLARDQSEVLGSVKIGHRALSQFALNDNSSYTTWPILTRSRQGLMFRIQIYKESSYENQIETVHCSGFGEDVWKCCQTTDGQTNWWTDTRA